MQWIYHPFIKKSEVARLLYDIPNHADLKTMIRVTAKFHNKCSRLGGAKFTEEEITKLQEIKNNYIKDF